MGYFESVRHVVIKADIVLLVIDARMPDMTRNVELEELVDRTGKNLVYVFNKCDLVSQGDLKKLKDKFSNAFFVSGVKNRGIANLRTGILIIARRMGIELPHVGVIGYPNVGKSAIINALAHGSRTKVSSVAGTTKGLQWVKVGKIRVIDSPGVIQYTEGEKKLGLMGAKNPEQMRDPDIVAGEIIEHCLKKNKASFEKYYGIKIAEGASTEEILIEIGKKRGFLAKGGIVDEKRTSINIIREWQTGKLKI
jgi:ribosome biogenesis GTPase A